MEFETGTEQTVWSSVFTLVFCSVHWSAISGLGSTKTKYVYRNRLNAIYCILYVRNYSNIISGIVLTSTDLGRVRIAIQGTVYL